MDKSERMARVEFRIPAELKREVEEAAALMGSTFSAFAAQTLVERARAVRRERNMTALSDSAARAFAEMTVNPPEPSEALRHTLREQTIRIPR